MKKKHIENQLLKSKIPENPMELFQKWFHGIEDYEVSNSMNLSTIGADGFPKNRMVLLKKTTWEGFIFYTNYKSEKGISISKKPNVCVSFFWQKAEQQIIIKGIAEKISENLSDGYFESRPRGSKIGSWASNQSQVINSREELDLNFKKLEEKYKNTEIPRPKNWGGYIVKPISMEFWQGKPNRMHDRILYSLEKNFEWKIERLAP